MTSCVEFAVIDEHAVERMLVAKHEIAKLQARSLYGDDVPTAEEWGNALQAVRDTTFEASKAEMYALVPKPVPESHRASVPGRVSMTFTTLKKD